MSIDSAKSLRSVLLTFDALSETQLPAGDHVVRLQQHYRTPQGWQSLCGSASEPAGSVNDGDSAASPQSLSLIRVSANAALEQWQSGLPTKNASLDDFPQMLEEHLGNSVNDDILWIHVHNETGQGGESVESLINTVVDRLPEGTMLAVSARELSVETNTHDFDIFAPEPSLRAPAVIRHSEFDRFTLQTLTGSHDLLFTLRQHAAGLAVEELQVTAGDSRRMKPRPESGTDGGDSTEQGRAIDLRACIRQPGIQPSRRLAVRQGSIVGLREHDFLYVAEVDPEGSGRQVMREGLYEKPQDSWNVHDVSSEYLELTDSLRNSLGLI